jgi:hypothetical protein
MNDTINDDFIDNDDIETIEKKAPKQKREYVMTEARALAIERMKEGRLRKAEEKKIAKQKPIIYETPEIIMKPKSVKKIAKKKPIIVYESSDEEEPAEIIVKKKPKKKPIIVYESSDEEPEMKPSRRPSRRLPASPLTLPEPEPVPFRLKRM